MATSNTSPPFPMSLGPGAGEHFISRSVCTHVRQTSALTRCCSCPPYLCFSAHLRTPVLAVVEVRSAIRTGDILGSLAGLAGRARGDSRGRGRGGPLAAVHRGGTGQSGPGRGTVEDYRSSCGMQNLPCKRGKQTGQLVCFCLLIRDHTSSMSDCSPKALCCVRNRLQNT